MKQPVKTSRAAGQLEKMFRELNKHYFNLSLIHISEPTRH